MRTMYILIFAGMMVVTESCWGISGAEMAALMDSIENCQIDPATVSNPSGLVLTKQDFALQVDSGWCAWFEPVVIDSVTHYYALYISGHGILQFAPTPKVEKGQLSRFFDSDSLNREFTEAVIFMGDSAAAALRQRMTSAGRKLDKRDVDLASGFKEGLTGFANRWHVYALLRSLTHHADGELLTVYANLKKGGKVCYQFDPWEREEVQFSKHYEMIGYLDYLETVCSYAVGATGIETSLNGTSKDIIKAVHYDIDASIDRKGAFVGAEQLTCTALMPGRSLNFYLHEELEVDSVSDQSGVAIAFKRYHHVFDNWWPGLYLFFDNPLAVGDTTTIMVYCHGKIAESDLDFFYVTAGASWYPRYGFFNPATFSMKFRTPREVAFVATGEMLGSDTIKNTVTSTWRVTEPANFASFTIGMMDKYRFSDSIAGNVDIYYSETLHRQMVDFYQEVERAAMVDTSFTAMTKSPSANVIGKHMEKQVAGDVVNALRLFIHRFGAVPYKDLSVSETLLRRAEAYPGFIHIGWRNWESADKWGGKRMTRAHEVAHQWWGTGVNYETYHDQWLSEGFATYSAYIYLQAAMGNDLFFDRLKDSRKEVISVREKPTDSSSETGPIILGYRTSSTKSKGDASLMIYQKGAHVLHMIRNMLIDWRTMDESRFFSMMKEYYESYRGTTATTADFQRMVEKYMGEEMTWFFDEWVYGTEIPTYKFSYTIEPGEKNTFTAKCHVVTEGVSPEFRMYVPVEIQIDDKRKAYVAVSVEGLESSFSLPGLPIRPKKLVLNPFESVLAEVKQ